MIVNWLLSILLKLLLLPSFWLLLFSCAILLNFFKFCICVFSFSSAEVGMVVNKDFLESEFKIPVPSKNSWCWFIWPSSSWKIVAWSEWPIISCKFCQKKVKLYINFIRISGLHRVEFYRKFLSFFFLISKSNFHGFTTNFKFFCKCLWILFFVFSRKCLFIFLFTLYFILEAASFFARNFEFQEKIRKIQKNDKKVSLFPIFQIFSCLFHRVLFPKIPGRTGFVKVVLIIQTTRGKIQNYNISCLLKFPRSVYFLICLDLTNFQPSKQKYCLHAWS